MKELKALFMSIWYTKWLMDHPMVCVAIIVVSMIIEIYLCHELKALGVHPIKSIKANIHRHFNKETDEE